MRIDITIGTGYDAVGNAVLFREEKADHVISQAAGLFGGVTVTEGQGAWVEPKTGKLVKEPTITLTVYADVSADLEARAEQLAEIAREAFEQTSVLLAYAPGHHEFVTQSDAVAVG